MSLSVEGSIVIEAPVENIWDTLTNPEKIFLYMIESRVATDWQPGSPVRFTRDRLHPKAERSGKLIEDKGQIFQFEPGKLLQFSYWSSQEGYPDLPENYTTITYTLTRLDASKIMLSYLREKIPLAFEQKNQARFLQGMLKEIKRIAEEGSLTC